MTKTRLNLSLDHDLVDFVKVYAQENRTTVSEMMTQFILTLKRKAIAWISFTPISVLFCFVSS